MNTRLLLGIMPLGGAAVAAFIIASQSHRRPEPELPEHRTLRLLGHEVEALTNRLRDLATRTPDVQRLIADVGELRGDVRRLAGEVEAYQVECVDVRGKMGEWIHQRPLVEVDWADMQERIVKIRQVADSARQTANQMRGNVDSQIGALQMTLLQRLDNLEERLAKLERDHPSYPRASFPMIEPGIGGGGTIAMVSNSGLSASAHPPAESEKPEGVSA